MTEELKPLKILMILDSLNIGGTETHVLTLAKALQSRGHQVIIGTSGGPLTQHFQQAGLEVKLMSFQSDNPLASNYVTLLEQARTIIQEYEIDLIHAHLIAGLKIAAQISQESLIPVVFTAHGMFYPRRQLQSHLTSVEHAIAVSLPAAAFLNSRLGFPKEQISVVPNGIDLAHFAPQQRGSFREELGLEPGEALITLCSRIAWGKTRVIEETIKAVEELQKTHKARLAIVGSGPDSGFIKSLAGMVNRRQGRELITLTGAMLDPLEAYLGSDVVIGTARIALEAMACHKPVIAAGNAGYVGLITPQNFTQGWERYFGDHDFLAYTTSSRIKGDLEQVLEGALGQDQLRKLRKLVAQHFSIQQVTTEIERIYYQVLGLQHWSEEEASLELPSRVLPSKPQPPVQPSVQTERPAELRREQDLPSAPLVSVAIPTYNQAEYILECLQALEEQTYRPLEIIIVDDHSTDQTEQVVAQWLQKVQGQEDFTAHYFRLPWNLGFAAAQTIAYLLSSGEFIANHDSDDLSHPHRIQDQVQFLLMDEEYSLVGTNYEVFTTNPNKRSKSYLVRYDNSIINCYREGQHCVCFGSLLFRRSVLQRIGGLTSFMEGAEDYEFVARAIVQGFHVQNLRRVLYYYRQHEKQRSREFYQVRNLLTNFGTGDAK